MQKKGQVLVALLAIIIFVTGLFFIGKYVFDNSLRLSDVAAADFKEFVTILNSLQDDEDRQYSLRIDRKTAVVFFEADKDKQIIRFDEFNSDNEPERSFVLDIKRPVPANPGNVQEGECEQNRDCVCLLRSVDFSAEAGLIITPDSSICMHSDFTLTGRACPKSSQEICMQDTLKGMIIERNLPGALNFPGSDPTYDRAKDIGGSQGLNLKRDGDTVSVCVNADCS